MNWKRSGFGDANSKKQGKKNTHGFHNLEENMSCQEPFWLFVWRFMRNIMIYEL